MLISVLVITRISNEYFKESYKMIYRLLLIFVSLLFSITCQAQNFILNLGEDTAQVSYSSNVGGSEFGRSELKFGYLHNSVLGVDFAEIGLLVIDVAGTKSPGLEVGIGPKLFYATLDCCDAVAIGLGGTLRYKLGNNSRFYLAGQFYFAPGVVSFSDSKSMYEAVLEFGFEVLPTADIYVGIRDIKVDFGGPEDVTIDDTAYFGMKLSF